MCVECGGEDAPHDGSVGVQAREEVKCRASSSHHPAVLPHRRWVKASPVVLPFRVQRRHGPFHCARGCAQEAEAR